jgi:hypothetical protein
MLPPTSKQERCELGREFKEFRECREFKEFRDMT